MKKSFLLLLYFLGAGIALVAVAGQKSPGYMDADYYYALGMQIATGESFSEPFLWNYLDDPIGLPHPSHLYWMPLASILAAAAMVVMGSTDYWAARIPFILLSGLIPIISASLAMFFLKDKNIARLAGLLGVFSGLYVIYLSIPETFVLYLVLGGMFWLIIFTTDWKNTAIRSLFQTAGLLGILAGMMHLSRADGILWACAGGVWLIWVVWQHPLNAKLRIAIIGIGIFVLGYALIMGGWYARNLDLFGSIMPPGNNRTLWITDYNQTFSYPADQLTMSKWLEAGMAVHLNAWWSAIQMNLKNLVAVQGAIILFPLMLAGLWVNRSKPAVKFAAIFWLVNFFVMTFVFPYAGARGGFLHSASAFQCLLWAAAAAGLEQFIAWGVRKRNWNSEKATPRFAALLVVICALLTGWFYLVKVYGTGEIETRWGSNYVTYESILEGMKSYSVDEETVFMVNNPPGFFIATGHSSIVIPGGGTEQVLAAAARYGANYMILEEDQGNLIDLFNTPQDIGSLQYIAEISGAKLFCFDCK
ncbi:MAG: hypothetical protein ACYC3H_03055 [Bellilinea sp.]